MCKKRVTLLGFKPKTFWSVVRCSIQLSYSANPWLFLFCECKGMSLFLNNQLFVWFFLPVGEGAVVKGCRLWRLSPAGICWWGSQIYFFYYGCICGDAKQNWCFGGDIRVGKWWSVQIEVQRFSCMAQSQDHEKHCEGCQAAGAQSPKRVHQQYKKGGGSFAVSPSPIKFVLLCTDNWTRSKGTKSILACKGDGAKAA